MNCEKVKRPIIDSKKVITNAEIVTFEDLDSSEKNRLEYCCSYYPNNWHDGVNFSKEDAFFVKAQIDNNLLAEICVTRNRTKADLLGQNASMLYGKYRNRWKFTDENNFLIYDTDKFEGHHLLSINRSGRFDEVVVGPLLKAPNRMYITISESENYSNLVPEYTFN